MEQFIILDYNALKDEDVAKIEEQEIDQKIEEVKEEARKNKEKCYL